jgi:type VI secretion system protein VasD
MKRSWLSCCLLLLASVGCGGTVAARPRATCPVPADVQLEIEASDRVNPDETGRSLPTRLRLYQLTDLSRLETASFDDIWTHAAATLAQTIVSSEELVIYPRQVVVHRFKRAPRADFLVGVAVFREAQGDSWRTAQEWPLPGDPCQSQGLKPLQPPIRKLRLRMFLDGDRIDSVNGYAALPKRGCSVGTEECASAATQPDSNELRRNQRLRTFEEDPREPEIRPAP